MTSTSSPSSAGSNPSRRTLVRTAAWAGPAVVLATASPAYAASGPANIVVTAASGAWGNNTGNGGQPRRAPLNYTFTVTNTGGTASSGPIVLTTRLPAGADNVFIESGSGGAPNGWTRSVSNGILTLTRTQPLASEASITVTTTVITRDPDLDDGTERQDLLLVSVTAANAGVNNSFGFTLSP